MATTRFDIEYGLVWEGKLLDVIKGHYPFDIGQGFINSRNEAIRVKDFKFCDKNLVRDVEFTYIRGGGKLIVDIRTVVTAIKQGRLRFSIVGNV